jgi:hypothetical protein
MQEFRGRFNDSGNFQLCFEDTFCQETSEEISGENTVYETRIGKPKTARLLVLQKEGLELHRSDAVRFPQ